MNPTTIAGIILGVGLIVSSIAVTADSPYIFLSLPGLLIVFGGTLAATLVSYPLREVLGVFKTIWTVFRNENLYAEHDPQELVAVSRQIINADIRGAERSIEGIQNPFLRTGVQLVLDNTPANEIVELLEWRIYKLKTKEAAEAQIYHSMAMYAPAFGMLGTLVGLVNMLYTMGGAPMEEIGINMGLALLTTFYGVILANLFLKPVAIKFERRTEERVLLMNTIMEGVLLLARGHNPSYIREFLHTFVEQNKDELRSASIKDSKHSPKSKGHEG